MISAAYDVVDKSNEEIVRTVGNEISVVYPEAGEPYHSLVVREKRATYSSNPAVEQLRPRHMTTVSNLYLGGDWTATGFPATIEGAVVSGERCAAEFIKPKN